MIDTDSLNAVQPSPCEQVLFSVRVSRRMRDQVQQIADECNRSRNYMIKEAIKRLIAEHLANTSGRHPPEA